MRSLLNDTFAILFYDFLYKNICCRNSFELPQLVEAIQMSSHNICFLILVKGHFVNCFSRFNIHVQFSDIFC